MATVIGGGGDNTIDGSNEADLLGGGKGDDIVRGLGGDDVLRGGKGNDRLIGGEGDDVLNGGKGNYQDVFVFGPNSGQDVVADFQVGKDKLEISKGLNNIKKPSDVLDHATQQGKDVVIDLGDGNTITLKDVKLKDLLDKPKDHFDIV